MIKKGVLVLLSVCASALAMAQSATDSTKNDNKNVPEITYSLSAPKKYVIADIKISGLINSSYDDYVLINYSRLAVGDTIEVPGKEITTAVKQFLKQGLFADVAILATKMEGDKVWLEFKLRDNPRITDIRYSGMKKSEREEVQEKIEN